MDRIVVIRVFGFGRSAYVAFEFPENLYENDLSLSTVGFQQKIVDTWKQITPESTYKCLGVFAVMPRMQQMAIVRNT